jgi:hypothetical protein
LEVKKLYKVEKIRQQGEEDRNEKESNGKRYGFQVK